MARAVDLEIDVALEMVGQEADAALERQELGREGQALRLGRDEEVPGRVEVAGGQPVEHPEVEADLGQVPLVLDGRGRAQADRIAEIVEDRSRHDRVEVDDADALARAVVDHDVVELGVVVGDPLGDEARGQAVDDDARVLLPGQDEIDLGPDAAGAAVRVEFERGQEGVVALPGVVEIRDGLVEPPARQAGQHLLEVAEGLRGRVDVPEVLDLVVGPGAVDVAEHPPVGALRGPVEGHPVARRDDGEGLAVGVAPGGRDPFAGEARHPLDVLHELFGLAEDEVVDPLVDVLDPPPGLVEFRAVGVVDVAGRDGAGREPRPRAVEGGADAVQLGQRLLLHD